VFGALKANDANGSVGIRRVFRRILTGGLEHSAHALMAAMGMVVVWCLALRLRLDRDRAIAGEDKACLLYTSDAGDEQCMV
jgi:hypothetical protein